jgi:hypothetical protein
MQARYGHGKGMIAARVLQVHHTAWGRDWGQDFPTRPPPDSFAAALSIVQQRKARRFRHEHGAQSMCFIN